MNKNKFYITTTIPYVNAAPHIGFALEIVQADAIARLHRLLGEEVFHNFGSDEHGLKIYRKAQETGVDPQKYVDEYAEKFKILKQYLNLDYDNFIRTTDPEHIFAAQEFWRLCLENGDIYKKNYKVKYCVGCELEKTDSELINGRCEFHPTLELEIYEEENYFFKFSKYQKPLLDFYNQHPDFVIPEDKFNEIKKFVEGGLQDFSVSRLKTKMPWGVDVPNDPEHVMYVWFDALVNYISALGWPKKVEKFKEFWPGIQTAGKDNLRQQTAIWQAMLLSAKLPNTKQVYIHGFINVNGQRISKSSGNVIDPVELVKTYGTDAVRYYLLAKINPYGDSDFTIEKFEEVYNADLANGLGNLVARVAKLCETNNLSFSESDLPIKANHLLEEVKASFDQFKFDEGANHLWQAIKSLDAYLDKERPWELSGVEAKKRLGVIVKGSESVTSLLEIAQTLKPFLPETAEKILKQFNGKIKSDSPLFPRIK